MAMAALQSRGNASVMRRTSSSAPAAAPMAMTGKSVDAIASLLVTFAAVAFAHFDQFALANFFTRP
jgi:hypothetical protein